MKIVVAPNSFKETLTASEFVDIAKEESPGFEILGFPLSDGGDGFLDCVKGETINVEAIGPRGKKVDVAVKKDDNKVYIESASVLGLRLVSKNERNPLVTNSSGLGIVIKKIVDLGAQELIVGFGGSSTVDFGMGALSELGIKFLDAYDKEVPLNASGIRLVNKVISADLYPKMKNVKVSCACDVDNRADGVIIYAPQKGATPEVVELIEQGVKNIGKTFGKDSLCIKHGGAAGGIPLFFKLFLDADLFSGSEFLIQESGLIEQLEDADYVITGEGKIDKQTKYGKIPYLVAQYAGAKGTPVVAIVGEIGEIDDEIEKIFSGIFSIAPGPIDLRKLMVRTKQDLRRTVRQVFRLLSTMER